MAQHKQFMRDRLRDFGVAMWGWGKIKGEDFRDFIIDMSRSVGLDKSDTKQVLIDLEHTIKSGKTLRQQKEVFKTVVLSQDVVDAAINSPTAPRRQSPGRYGGIPISVAQQKAAAGSGPRETTKISQPSVRVVSAQRSRATVKLKIEPARKARSGTTKIAQPPKHSASERGTMINAPEQVAVRSTRAGTMKIPPPEHAANSIQRGTTKISPPNGRGTMKIPPPENVRSTRKIQPPETAIRKTTRIQPPMPPKRMSGPLLRKQSSRGRKSLPRVPKKYNFFSFVFPFF